LATHQRKVHTQPGPTPPKIFAANERMNPVLIEHLDSQTDKSRIIAARAKTRRTAKPQLAGKRGARSEERI
jgi:hypothetical protein